MTCGDADSPKHTKRTSQIKVRFGAPRRSRRRRRAREAREVLGAREVVVPRRVPLNAHRFSTKSFWRRAKSSPPRRCSRSVRGRTVSSRQPQAVSPPPRVARAPRASLRSRRPLLRGGGDAEVVGRNCFPSFPRVAEHALDDRVDLVYSLLRRPRARRGGHRLSSKSWR